MTPYLFSILDSLKTSCFFAALLTAAGAGLMMVIRGPSEEDQVSQGRKRVAVACIVASVVLLVAQALIPTRESWTEANRVFQEEGRKPRSEVITMR